ncbi:MAG: glutathione S-transferase family protein [Thiohalospira sp.]|uniref:glutathione S-transferase family protein n=1 Tax=Thiohalospira sp. TaxID=3080549 RepID=UPI003980B5D7
MELISFRLCPFVQRSVITLQEKGAEYDVTYIDLAEPPAWFLTISPFGKVPVLRVGESVVFESAVINEYVDEVTPPSLHPSDPLRKAVNRAWIEFGSDLIFKQYGLYTAADEETFEAKRHEVLTGLRQLEEVLGEGPWFNGAEYALVDTAYAPLFQRFELLEQWHAMDFLAGLPKVTTWHRALVERPTTTSSVAADFADDFRGYIARTEGYAARLYAAGAA